MLTPSQLAATLNYGAVLGFMAEIENIAAQLVETIEIDSPDCPHQALRTVRLISRAASIRKTLAQIGLTFPPPPHDPCTCPNCGHTFTPVTDNAPAPSAAAGAQSHSVNPPHPPHAADPARPAPHSAWPQSADPSDPTGPSNPSNPSPDSPPAQSLPPLQPLKPLNLVLSPLTLTPPAGTPNPVSKLPLDLNFPSADSAAGFTIRACPLIPLARLTSFVQNTLNLAHAENQSQPAVAKTTAREPAPTPVPDPTLPSPRPALLGPSPPDSS